MSQRATIFAEVIINFAHYKKYFLVQKAGEKRLIILHIFMFIKFIMYFYKLKFLTWKLKK